MKMMCWETLKKMKAVMTKASWPRGADLNPLVEIPEKIVPPKRYKLEN